MTSNHAELKLVDSGEAPTHGPYPPAGLDASFGVMPFEVRGGKGAHDSEARGKSRASAQLKRGCVAGHAGPTRRGPTFTPTSASATLLRHAKTRLRLQAVASSLDVPCGAQ